MLCYCGSCLRFFWRKHPPETQGPVMVTAKASLIHSEAGPGSQPPLSITLSSALICHCLDYYVTFVSLLFSVLVVPCAQGSDDEVIDGERVSPSRGRGRGRFKPRRKMRRVCGLAVARAAIHSSRCALCCCPLPALLHQLPASTPAFVIVQHVPSAIWCLESV